MSGNKPLENFTLDHIISRNKEIIANELIAESKRANDLSQACRNLQQKNIAVGTETKSTAPEEEQPNDTKKE